MGEGRVLNNANPICFVLLRWIDKDFLHDSIRHPNVISHCDCKILFFLSLKAKINDPTESPVSIFFNGPLDQIDVGSLTKMFEEATRSSILTNEFNSLFGDLAISSNAAIEGEKTMGHDKPNHTTNTKQRIEQHSKKLNG